jgi:hypothetical protein
MEYFVYSYTNLLFRLYDLPDEIKFHKLPPPIISHSLECLEGLLINIPYNHRNK